VDWIADYLDPRGDVARLVPGQSRRYPRAIAAHPPQQGEPFERMLRDVESILLPGITHWQSPHFFAFFPANNSGPSILGELLASGLGVQGMLWATSPACTELETHVLDWMVDLLDLPARFKSSGPGGGVIQDSASSAVLCALLAARERATNFATNQRGCDGRLVAYTSTQAHSSVEKAARIAGLGQDNLRMIEVDDQFAMRPDRLAERIARDRAAGLTPCFVSATSEPPHPTPSTRSRKSVPFVAPRISGSTWMPPCPAPPRSVPSSGTSTTGSSWPIPTPSIRTSGCSRTSIATASMWPIGAR
jgi:aromatic-L-amino-acid/L-tryptophan decarboxylase